MNNNKIGVFFLLQSGKNGKSEFSHYFLKLRLVGVVKKSPILMLRAVNVCASLLCAGADFGNISCLKHNGSLGKTQVSVRRVCA